MQYFIDLFREELGTEFMHSSPFLDASHKIVEELERLEKENKDLAKQVVDLEWREAVAYETCATRCAIISEADVGHNHPDACSDTCNIVADKIRSEFHVPKAG